MPPKVAPTPAAPVGKKVTVAVNVTKPHHDKDLAVTDADGNPLPPPMQGVRLRIFASWVDCAMLTPLFGDRNTGLGWKEIHNHQHTTDNHASVSEQKGMEHEEHQASPRNKRVSSSFSVQFGKELKEQDQIRHFHDDAALYFVFSYVHEDGKVDIVNIFTIDCSSFLFYTQDLQVHRKVFEDYEVDLKVNIEEPFANWNDMLALQPVVLRLKK